MSTRYTTVPKIPYDDFVARCKSVELLDPPSSIYIVPHRRMVKDGTSIYVFRETDGTTWFERYGAGEVHKIFPSLIAEFGCEIFDEYGLHYPEQSIN